MTFEYESVAESAGAGTSDEQLIAMLVVRARSEGLQLTDEGGLPDRQGPQALDHALESTLECLPDREGKLTLANN